LQIRDRQGSVAQIVQALKSRVSLVRIQNGTTAGTSLVANLKGFAIH
jgi:hypothetical protein